MESCISSIVFEQKEKINKAVFFFEFMSRSNFYLIRFLTLYSHEIKKAFSEIFYYSLE